MKHFFAILLLLTNISSCDKESQIDNRELITIETPSDGNIKANEAYRFTIEVRSEQSLRFNTEEPDKYLMIDDIKIKSNETYNLSKGRYVCSMILSNETTSINFIFKDKNGVEILKTISVKALPNKFDVISFDDIKENIINDIPFTYKIRLLKSNFICKHYFKYSFEEGSGLIQNKGTLYEEDSMIPINEIDTYIEITPYTIGATKIKFMYYDEYGFSIEKYLSFNTITKSDNLSINNVFTESSNGSISNIIFNVMNNDSDNTVSMKCELIKGDGRLQYNKIDLFSNSEIYVPIGNIRLEYTPNKPLDAEIKVTIKSSSGGVVSKSIHISVYKTNIEINT